MAMIWIPSASEAWEVATVVSSDANTVTVRRAGGSEVKVPGNVSSFAAVTNMALEENCENLVDLESYNEGIILHHIKKRFAADKIYTLVGNILIALNPYKSIDIYGLNVIERIYNQTKAREDTPPHVFSIAASAVANMRNEERNQSILISGESGAGKTEATKKILQFISTICTSTASRIGPSIEHQILDSNPLLEAFGNAKTLRNNNSSRFGKYMEVNFDKKHAIKGCNITAYLLEKSRVVKQGSGERNYHIFYMLLAGASKDMKRDFALKPPDQFNYLNQSGCVDIPRRDEQREHEDLLTAMTNLTVEPATQTAVFQCLAAILHMGNLEFLPSKDTDEGSRVAVPSDCRRVSALLGMDADALERVLCNKDTLINGEALLVPLTPAKASDQRDSLAKHIYSKLFDYLVHKVNASLFRGKPKCSIGVLDIFGFEVFQVNSFEQLCINYCNERLQTFFNEIIFDSEMKMYSAEGLPVDDINYIDNMGCVRLVDLRGGGIFAYLDEECAVPKGSDDKLVSKLIQIFEDNLTTKSVFFGRLPKNPAAFIVRHFAGDVVYDSKGFLEKNKDALAECIVALVGASSLPLLTQDYTPAAAVPAADAPKKKGSKMTLCAKFKADLDALMAALRATVPHFIRCIKPNMDQVGGKFDPPLALNQLKYSGLFEAIRIRKSGYEVRIAHDVFIARYKHCLTAVKENKADAKEYAGRLLEGIFEAMAQHPEMQERRRVLEKAAQGKKGSAPTTDAPKRQFCLGSSKVFLRSQMLKVLLDHFRDLCAGNVVIAIQSIVRGFLGRVAVLKMRGVSVAAREEERAAAKQEAVLMGREEARSQALEQAFRSDVGLQKRLQEAKQKRIQEEKMRVAKARLRGALLIQKVFRGYFYRRRARIFICERLLEMSLEARDEELMQRALARPAQLQASSKLISLYRSSVKKLILEVMNERYVENQISEALQVNSLDMLRTAIQLAATHRMPYLPILAQAHAAVARLGANRALLAALGDELSLCTSMPVLLQKADLLQVIIDEAAKRGLTHETKVIEASSRLQKVSSLLGLRARLRYAVEICSPSKMTKAMNERAALLRLFGDAFLAQEATAADNLSNMLRMGQTLLNGTPEDVEGGEAEAKGDGPKRMNMHDIYQLISGHGAAAAGAEEEEEEEEEDDIYLPKFVRDPLFCMRHAGSGKALNAALAEYVKLVPDAFHRAFYLRLFKWTVAFATWHRPDPALEEIKKIIGDTSEEVHVPAEEARGTARQQQRGRSPSPVRSLSGTFSAYSTTTGRKKKPGLAQVIQRTLRQQNRGPSFTSSPPPRSPSPPKGVGSPSNYIPFSQRQAKSEVAAREMLKKGKEHNFRKFEHHTDNLIHESLSNLKSFRSKLTTKSTF